MWNDDWRHELERENADCFYRLCDCANKVGDIAIIAKMMYEYNKDKEKEECLDRTIEWICVWNNQYNLEDCISKKYSSILKKMD